MIVVTEKGSSPILIVGETFEKNPTTVGAFVSDEANVALKIGVQTNFPSKYIDPHYIDLKREDLNDRTHYEFTEEIVNQVRQYITDNGIELVVCMGRTTMSMIFPSLVGKGKSLAKLVQSPFLEGLEIPGVKACCIYGYSQAYDNNNENALQEYWGRLKEIFVEKPTYYVPETEITSEEELIQLLDFLDTIPKDTKLGLDYETNAVQQFHVDYKTTMIGLSYLHDKNTAPSFWFPLDIKPSDKLVERISKFFDDNHKRIWAHNCVFEILSSWHEFGKHWEFQDTLVLLTVQGKRASLKDAMRTHLGATLWESSVTEFREKTEELYKWLEKCKYQDEVFELAKKKDWKALSELHDKLNSCIDWVSDNYSEEHLPRVFDAYPYPWASVPPEVLGPYCAKDAGYTLLLSEYMWKPELERAYDYAIVHPYLAAKFEANGAHWDEEKAKEVESEIVDKMLTTLYDLIMMLDTVTPDEKMVAKDIYFKELPYDVITYTEKTKKEKRRTVSTKLDKVNELKGILNLGSNTAESRAKFWDCYFTEELQMGTILNVALEDIEFNQMLQPLTEKLGEGFSFYGKHPSVGLEILANVESKLGNSREDKEIVAQVARSLNMAIDTLPEKSGRYATEVIKYQYIVHSRYLGVDINDESTWSKEFKMLFNAYYHKKLSKTLSTNINGTIGRQIVYEEVSKLHGVDLRGASITEKPELKRGVMDFSFNPLSADTHRWTANFHVVPAGSSTRLALIPPSDRYLVNHSDYSQAEISVLAFYSQDERLIEAFLSGRDMHRYVASLAFNLEYDKVSSEQRRSAKAIVFGLLYGKSVASLAMDVSGGDVNKAQELMDVFFKAFPKIKDWMKTKYEEIDKHPYVTNAFGAILNVDVTQADKGAKYRNACLVGSTKIKTLNGVKTIEEIMNSKDKTYSYGYNLSTNAIEPVEINKVWESKRVTKTVKVTLDNGNSFECTPDHRVLLSSGDYVEAGELSVGSSLMPIYYSLTRDGRTKVSGKSGKWFRTFDLVGEKYVGLRNPGECYHHLDHDKLNDNPENLVKWTTTYHNSYHAKHRNANHVSGSDWDLAQRSGVKSEIENRLSTFGNVLGVSSEEYSKLMKDKWEQNKEDWSARIRAGHQTETARENHSRASSEYRNSKEFCISVIHTHMKKVLDMGISVKTPAQYDYGCLLLDTTAARYSNILEPHGVSWDEVLELFDSEYEQVENNPCMENRGIFVQEVLNFGFSSRVKYKLLSLIQENMELLEASSSLQELKEGGHNFSRFSNEQKAKVESIVRNATGLLNHNVVSIEEVRYDSPIPVYDFTVNDTHNVALDCGIFVHNCNAPIQNFASMTAGTFMYYFTKALESKGIHTAPFGFVHDAYDDIVPVDYLIEYLNLQKEVMQYAVRDSIGIPIILDQEVGPNALYMNHIKVIKAEGDTIRIQLGGDVEGHEDILRRLGTSETYAVQNIEVLDSSEKTHSFEELFTVGKALKHEWGRTIKEQTIELDLVYHSGVHPDVSYLTRK